MLNINNTENNYLLQKVADTLVEAFPEFSEESSVSEVSGQDVLDLSIDAPSWNTYPLWVLVRGHLAIIGFDHASRSVSFLSNDLEVDQLVDQLKTTSEQIINEELVSVTWIKDGEPVASSLRVPSDDMNSDWAGMVDAIRVRSWNGTHDRDEVLTE